MSSEAQPVSNLYPLTLSMSLITRLDEREHAPEDVSDADWVKNCDASWSRLCESLRQTPFKRWMGLCGGVNNDPALLAAASYCEDYNAEEIAVAVAASESKWVAWPNSRAARAAALSAVRDGVQAASVADEIEKTWYADAVAWHLAATEQCPTHKLSDDLALKMNEAPASQLAWQFARHGFDETVEEWLVKWLKRGGTLAFWASAALLVRRPAYHQFIDGVVKLAADHPVNTQYAAAMAGAIRSGPYTPETALTDVEELFEGPRDVRLQRAMRLAMFVPGNTPLVDPGLPYPWQERAAVRLATILQESIASNASFMPDAYADKKPQLRVLSNA